VSARISHDVRVPGVLSALAVAVSLSAPRSLVVSAPESERRRISDARPVNLLLLVPIVLSLAVPLYNSIEPTLGGIPLFYWFQLGIIPIGVLCTVIVYRSSKDQRR
jgi:Protein of unknown function (DUF3311)